MTRAAASVRRYPRFLFTDLSPVNDPNTASSNGRSPERPPDKLDAAEAMAAIQIGWTAGLGVRETARRATRAPSYVHSVFVRLDAERGPRPANTATAKP
jgi:site-specific recombinase XerC